MLEIGNCNNEILESINVFFYAMIAASNILLQLVLSCSIIL
jgi:hypothetical protein